MGFAASCVKYTMFFFNLLFLLAGAALIALGTVIFIKMKEFVESLGDFGKYVNIVPIVIIVVGCIIFIISFLGCCGAIRESVCMLVTFGIILLIICIIQVALATYIYVKFKHLSTDLEKDIEDALESSISDYWKTNTTQAHRDTVDFFQRELECCGIRDKNDWIKLPNSCCPTLGNNTCVYSQAYPRGCIHPLFDVINKNAKIVAIVIYCIAAFELLSAIAAFCLTNSVRNDYRRGRY